MKSESINIQSENTGENEITLTITVDAGEMADRLESALRDYQKKAQIDGFRPGKVPLRIVRQRFGSTIRGRVIEDTIDESYQDALDKENLKPIAPGNIKEIKFDSDSPLVYKAVVSITPDFELAKLDKLSVERELVSIRDEDIDQTLQELREEAGVLNPLDGEAVDGSIIECDLQELDPNGVPLIGKTWKDIRIEIGKSPFGQDFDTQLLGIKADENRDVMMRQQSQDAQGRKEEEIRYRMTAKALKNKELPELNDEFAKSIDEQVDSLDGLKENVRKYWEGRTARESQDRFHHRLVDAVVKAHSFILPKSMIDDYLDRMVANAKKRTSKNEFDEESFRQQHRASAIWNLKWILIRRKLAEQESLNSNDQDVEDAIQKAVESGADEEQIRMTYNVPERRQELLSDITERKVLEWLTKQAKVVERKVDTDNFYGRKSIVLPE
ncbi:hypothetical protein AMJ86_01365 [bacterium SM23_57]|nr:MAG: hypothetical protein AMJ86_01365 [bacterium SM23_57]